MPSTAFVAGLRASGWVARMVVDGPINGDVFLAYLEQQLSPSLQSRDILIMDNLSSHKRACVREQFRITAMKQNQAERGGFEPLPENALSFDSTNCNGERQYLTAAQALQVGGVKCHCQTATDAVLIRLIDSWPSLSEPIKLVIFAMIKASDHSRLNDNN